MSLPILVLLLGLCVVASALYNGSEIGFYSLARVRVELEARHGRGTARLVAFLMRDDSALLVTVLIGNNLMLEIIAHLGDDLARRAGVADLGVEIALTVCLSPLVLLFAEVLPKELFRRRPHVLVGVAAPWVAISRVAFWPLERLLRLLTRLLERLLGLESRSVTRLRGREALLHFLAEGRRAGALHERAEALARNALKLRSVTLYNVMVPWGRVQRLERGQPEAALRTRLRESRYSRLPVVDEHGAVQGYVHQLDAFVPEGEPGPVLENLRPLPCLPADTPVDRALRVLRGSGQRMLAVGQPSAPVGLVTLKDLVEEISGDLAGW